MEDLGDVQGETATGPTGATPRRLLQRAGVGALATVTLAGVLLGGLTAAGAVGGLPSVFDDSPESTTTTVPTTTTVVSVPESTVPTPETTVPAPPTRVIDVPGVGQVVVIDGPVPTVVSVTALPGYTVVPDDDPSEPGELHLRFLDAFGGRIDVQAEYEDGQLRIRVRDRRLEDSSGGGTSDADDAGDDDSGGGDDRARGWGGDDTWGGAPAGGVSDSPGSPSWDAPTGGSSGRGSDDSGGRGRGGDDSGSDDSGGRGRGGDDSGSDDSGGRGRGGDDSGSDDSGDDD